MIFEAGLLLALAGLGRTIDAYATPRAKQTAGTWMLQSKAFNWHTFVAERSWYIFTTVFGDHGTTPKFIKRSLAVYVFLCVVSILFLEAYFPETATAVTSVWR